MKTPYKHKRTKKSSRTHTDNRNLEQLASTMLEICRTKLPDGKIQGGPLQGLEPDIRQEAVIMALDGFLFGNPVFHDGLAEGDETKLAMGMDRCASITLRIAKLRLTREVMRHRSRECELTETIIGSVQAPVYRQPSDWQLDEKIEMLLAAVSRAIRQGKLSQANGAVVFMACNRGLPILKIAGKLGITPRAVYLRLERVRSVLPEIIEWVEVKPTR